MFCRSVWIPWCTWWRSCRKKVIPETDSQTPFNMDDWKMIQEEFATLCLFSGGGSAVSLGWSYYLMQVVLGEVTVDRPGWMLNEAEQRGSARCSGISGGMDIIIFAASISINEEPTRRYFVKVEILPQTAVFFFECGERWSLFCWDGWHPNFKSCLNGLFSAHCSQEALQK